MSMRRLADRGNGLYRAGTRLLRMYRLPPARSGGPASAVDPRGGPGLEPRDREGPRAVNLKTRIWIEFAVAFALYVAAVVVVLLMLHKVSAP